MAPRIPLTIGVDVGGTKIASALVDAQGHALATDRRPTGAERAPGQVLDDVAASIRACLPAGDPSFVVGVGMAGQGDPATGIIRRSPNLPTWADVPLVAALQDRLRAPVFLTNDVRAAAWGEWKHGAGMGVSHLACIFIGTGVGGGIVIHGHMLEGATGAAGELGHQTVQTTNGRACHCPNRGCLEAYAGGWAIAERAQEAARADPGAAKALLHAAGGPERITAETVAEAHRHGDPLAENLVEETATFLAAGLATVVNAFNPQRLVLGGGVLDGIPDLIPRAERQLRARALLAALDPLDVVPARLGRDAAVLGAAALARQRAAEESV